MPRYLRTIALLICFVLIFPLCACGVKPDKNGIIKLGTDEFSSSSSSIYLYDESITDISALKYCSELEYLDISECNIEDLSPLLECPKLKKLTTNGYTFSKNFAVINSISSLEDFSVIIQEDDIVPSEKIILANIDSLGISNMSRKPIDLALFDMPQLRSLSVYGGVNNISAVEKLEKLEILSISCDALIRNVPFPSSLKCLSVRKYDLTGVENLPNLEHLFIDNILSVGLDKLRCAKKLKTLVISFGNINDISFLEDLTELERLELRLSPNAKNIAVIEKLANLKELTLSGEFEDISPIAELHQLKYLCLDGRYTDVSAVAQLENLVSVTLYSAELSDITPLLKEVVFESLVVGGEKIPKEQLDRFAELNPDCILRIDALHSPGGSYGLG